jgi:hypothetical protein
MLLTWKERIRRSRCGVGWFDDVAVVDCVHKKRKARMTTGSILASKVRSVFDSRTSPRDVYTYD